MKMENCVSKVSNTFMKSRMVKGQLDFHQNPYYPHLTKKLLDSYRVKHSFRVSCGKSKWLQYEKFNPLFNLRQVLDDEIVIEFDDTKFQDKGDIEKFQNEVSWPATNFTAINLQQANITFEVWDHCGKSPHIHIHDLPITHLDKDKRKKFKEFFIKKFVPEEYQKYTDTSLCGIHLVALEWTQHWKGCYSIKKLLHKFESDKEVAQ